MISQYVRKTKAWMSYLKMKMGYDSYELCGNSTQDRCIKKHLQKLQGSGLEDHHDSNRCDAHQNIWKKKN